ncbi:MAG: polysaccharide biosynthesis tyrosine autokinase [Pleurocapsa sp.]
MESSQSSLGITRYWQIIKRRWIPGTAVLLSVLTLGVVSTLLKEPVYEANAKLRFKKNNPSSSLTELTKAIGTLSPLAEKGNPIDTEAEVIRSVPLIQKTITDLNLTNQQGTAVDVDSFLENLQVRSLLSTDVLEISYEDENPQIATTVVNTLIANYLENNILVNRAEAVAAREFLEEQLPQAEKILQDAEASIRKIQEENKIISLEAEAEAIVANLRDLQAKIAETEGEIASTRSQAAYIRNKLGFDSDQALAAAAIGQSPEIRETVTKLQNLEAELAQEQTRFTDNNPKIIDLKNKVESLKNILQNQTQTIGGANAKKLYGDVKFTLAQQQLTTELITLEALNVGLTEQLNNLTQVEQEIRTKAKDFPRLEQQLRRLERKLGASQSTYELLLQQLQTIQLAENQNIGNVRVIAYAVVPEKPVSSRAVAYLASASLAMLAAAGVIYLLEITDQSIKTIEEAKQIFGYPWLGVIPDLDKLKLVEIPEANSDPIIPKLVVRDYATLPISESYRMLQSNLKFISSDRQVKSIVITSSVAQEGKSAVAANLALAMAQVGHRVLLVDADLHHPMQHRIWDTYNDNGLSNAIAEQRDPNALIEHMTSNLDLLTSGVIPPSPATLLDSQRMRILMDYWSESYDFVIIDTPALDLAADAPIMGRMADGVLLVVKPGAVERAKASFTKEIIEQSGQNMLGIVFNGVSPKVEPRTYYYHSLEDKQELLESSKLLDSPQEELWETISRLARESKKNQINSNLDSEQLSAASVEQLERMVADLQQDLADLTRLVKEQEEELLMQRQKVKKLRRKVNIATESDRPALEAELEQEQERKRMLDQTLIGQRRNLEKRKEILYEYQQALEDKQQSSSR